MRNSPIRNTRASPPHESGSPRLFVFTALPGREQVCSLRPPDRLCLHCIGNFHTRQFPPARATSNGTELQCFATGIQTAVLSCPTGPGTDTSEPVIGDSDRIIAPDSVEGSMLVKEGKAAHHS
jgi:hypothetical protein